MPVRLGQFYALMLLLTCLAVNIAFFPEVREPFLGDEDPLASVKSAFADLDVQAKIAEFYPKVQSNVDEVSNVTPLEEPKEETPTPKVEERAPREQRRPPPLVQPEEVVPLPKEEPKESVPSESAKNESPPVLTPVRSEVHLQTAATMPVPKPAAAVVQPAVAEQFNPVLIESKPTELVKPVKPSSQPIWETIETVLERPIRYDR